MENIRNFVIIAHIDHGKSTLADRFLEITKTVEQRVMKPQYLDQMDIERERGITIKMAPVRMNFRPAFANESYILNLIDTPGHSDFSYEVSRALLAVEGAILLVDATQGIQAQTLANFHAAKKAGLTIVGAVNKVDLNPPTLEAVINDLALLLQCPREEIYKVSGKTGLGAEELLLKVIEKVPPPELKKIAQESAERKLKQALVFDSFYDDHKGVMAFARVFGGSFKPGDETKLIATDTKFKIKELGHFSPKLTIGETLGAGEIGYFATGLKDPDKLKIGDTIGDEPLAGYKEPKPVVFVSVYPSEDADYDDLKVALHKLKLNDASFTFEPDTSEVLGRGFKCGFLGRLHFEIITERLKREFNLETVNSFPTVEYKVKQRDAWLTIRNPKDFPDDYDEALEPVVGLEILTPKEYLGDIYSMQGQFRFSDLTAKNFGDEYIIIDANLPLADLISDFDDKLKSISRGYASFSYDISGEAKADLIRLEILVAEEIVPGLTRVVIRGEVERAGREMVERLKELLPKQQFAQALQAKAHGRIIARETIAAMRKDVTGYLYGGDRTRKMKLWKKQQKGKKRLKATGRVEISSEIFKELLKK